MHFKFTRKDILTIPNAMSFFRLLLIPVIVWLYCGQENYLWTVVVIVLSAATDIADGKIARRFSMVSDFGKVLDPVADKLTQMALIICLLSRYPWLWLLLALFVMKEALMAFWGYLTIKFTDCINSARWYGKLSTVILYASMMILFLFPQISETVAAVLIAACAFVMVLSLVVLIARVMGILPSDIVSLYMGAVGVNYPKYLLGCLLGMLRSTITFPIMGMSITDIHSPVFMTALCVELLLMAISVLICRIYRKKHR